jgi:hypothetical protein
MRRLLCHAGFMIAPDDCRGKGLDAANSEAGGSAVRRHAVSRSGGCGIFDR